MHCMHSHDKKSLKVFSFAKRMCFTVGENDNFHDESFTVGSRVSKSIPPVHCVELQIKMTELKQDIDVLVFSVHVRVGETETKTIR